MTVHESRFSPVPSWRRMARRVPQPSQPSSAASPQSWSMIGLAPVVRSGERLSLAYWIRAPRLEGFQAK